MSALCPVICLWLLISFGFCCWFFENLCIVCHVICEPVFFFFFSEYMNIFYFLFSYFYTKISSMMLNRRNEGGYHCLVPHFRGRWSSFLQLSMMLAVDFFVCVLYKVDELSLFIVCWELLVMNGCCILLHVFSLPINMIILFF